MSTSRIGILDYILTTMSMLFFGDSSMEEGSARNRSGMPSKIDSLAQKCFFISEISGYEIGDLGGLVVQVN